MEARLLATFLILSVLSLPCSAAELTDLGEGLSYLRIHAMDDAAKGLTSALRERESLIVDLRHANTKTESAALLRAALVARATKQPVYILVGPATPSALGETLTAATGKCVTLGIKESMPIPQVIIDQSADGDQLAYDALESGQPIASLISGKIGKDRFDEAALMKEFNNGNTNATLPPPPDPVAKTNTPANSPAPTKPATNQATPSKGEPPAGNKSEPLTDRVLQRAVHINRALAAIKQR